MARQMSWEAEQYRLRVDREELGSGGTADETREALRFERYCREHFFDDPATGEPGYLSRWLQHLEREERAECAGQLFETLQECDPEIACFNRAFAEGEGERLQQYVEGAAQHSGHGRGQNLQMKEAEPGCRTEL